MDQNSKQGEGPQEQKDWQKKWTKLSRNLSELNNRELRTQQLDKQKRKHVEEFLESYKGNPAVIGFRGWTQQEYQKHVDLAFELCDHVKGQSFSGYTKNSTGRYEKPILQLPDKNAIRSRNLSEIDYGGDLSHLEELKAELEKHLKDVESLKSLDFNKLSADIRYGQLERFSRLYIQEIRASSEWLGAADKQSAQDSIKRCERLRASAERSMKQWEKSKKSGEKAPFYVHGHLRLLRRSTEQQLNTLEKISRGESLQERNQSGTFQEQLHQADTVEDRSHIVEKYYDKKVENILLLRDNSIKLWKKLTESPGRDALKVEVSSTIEEAEKIENALREDNRKEVLKGLRHLDRAIENLLHIHLQFHRTQLSIDYYERSKDHMKGAGTLQTEREQHYEDLRGKVKQTREEFFKAVKAEDSATYDQNKETALTQWHKAVNKQSKFVARLVKAHYQQLENNVCDVYIEQANTSLGRTELTDMQRARIRSSIDICKTYREIARVAMIRWQESQATDPPLNVRESLQLLYESARELSDAAQPLSQGETQGEQRSPSEAYQAGSLEKQLSQVANEEERGRIIWGYYNSSMRRAISLRMDNFELWQSILQRRMSRATDDMQTADARMDLEMFGANTLEFQTKASRAQEAFQQAKLAVLNNAEISQTQQAFDNLNKSIQDLSDIRDMLRQRLAQELELPLYSEINNEG